MWRGAEFELPRNGWLPGRNASREETRLGHQNRGCVFVLLAETIDCPGGGFLFHNSPSHISSFPPSTPSPTTSLHPLPPSFPVFTLFHVACPCTEYIPLVAATKCPPRCSPRLDVPAQRIVRARGGRDLLRALQYPLQLLNGSQSFRNVPNYPASCQNSRILPERSTILSSNSMPRIYANLVLLYHTSAMPSPFAAPCAFLFYFLFRWSGHMRHAMLTYEDLPNHIGYMIVRILARNCTPQAIYSPQLPISFPQIASRFIYPQHMF